MPTLAQCLSALIASGNGQNCNKALKEIHSELTPEEAVLFKNGEDDRLKIAVANILNPYLSKIDLFYFGKDLEK
jgi:hypothetical protein